MLNSSLPVLTGAECLSGKGSWKYALLIGEHCILRRKVLVCFYIWFIASLVFLLLHGAGGALSKYWDCFLLSSFSVRIPWLRYTHMKGSMWLPPAVNGLTMDTSTIVSILQISPLL